MDTWLIPVRKFKRAPGTFTWKKGPWITGAREADLLPLGQLAADLQRLHQIRLRTSLRAGGPSALRVTRAGAPSDPEAYRLTIRPDGIEVVASGDAGAYYGVQTLRELTILHGPKLPCGQIDDHPDFRRRGVYYDCARGKIPTVETVKALVERLASWKVNELQLFLKNAFTWQAHPAIGKGFSPYTPEDLLAIQTHCRLHHVRFVPSLATLSHQELILQLPAYRHLAEKPGHLGWEGGTLMCPTDRRTLQYVESIYSEFVPLFEAADFNVCCDEPWELGQGRSARAVSARGAGRVYLEFLLKLHRLCERFGKRMNVWGDIVMKHPDLIPEVPRDMVMLNWDYDARGASMERTCAFTQAGLPVLVCPGTSSWQRHGTDMPVAMANIARFAAIGRREGAEGLLNTDWGDFGHRNTLGVSLYGLAYGAAHAWNGRAVKDNVFADVFVRRVFGAGTEWAIALRGLGDAAATAAPQDSTCLYHALVEPLEKEPGAFFKRFSRVPLVAHYPGHVHPHIQNASADALPGLIERLSAKNFWPALPRGLPPFERLALLDAQLASRMDVLAAERCMLGQSICRGEHPAPAQLRAWADAVDEVAAEFKTLWLTRHRPSRLADNLKLMTLAAQECRVLAR